MSSADETSHATPANERVPRWLWAASAALVVAGLAVLILGRGGTPVLIGTALLVLAIALPLLALPDRDPESDGAEDPPSGATSST